MSTHFPPGPQPLPRPPPPVFSMVATVMADKLEADHVAPGTLRTEPRVFPGPQTSGSASVPLTPITFPEQLTPVCLPMISLPQGLCTSSSCYQESPFLLAVLPRPSLSVDVTCLSSPSSWRGCPAVTP